MDHLIKPVVPEILRAKVAVFVDLYQKTQRLLRLERWEADRQLAAERARLAALVESSEDAIIGRSPDGRISSWNEAAERLFQPVHRAPVACLRPSPP